jgi:hypothetical protein
MERNTTVKSEKALAQSIVRYVQSNFTNLEKKKKDRNIEINLGSKGRNKESKTGYM